MARATATDAAEEDRECPICLGDTAEEDSAITACGHLSSPSLQKKIEIAELYCVDLGESFQTYIYLQNFVSIQPRTSLVKFAAPCPRWRASKSSFGCTIVPKVPPQVRRGLRAHLGDLPDLSGELVAEPNHPLQDDDARYPQSPII